MGETGEVSPIWILCLLDKVNIDFTVVNSDGVNTGIQFLSCERGCGRDKDWTTR